VPATREFVINRLYDRGIIADSGAVIEPLTGGVSSDIFLVDDGQHRVVVKMALDTLKVKDEWRADIRRNLSEQRYIKYVGTFLPQVVPKLVYCDEENYFFVMEHLDSSFVNWKQELLAGNSDPLVAEEAGKTLGIIHCQTWESGTVREIFDTTDNFHDLRTDPYLLTTGLRWPELQSYCEEEAERLENRRLCLVHGDYSPKNILINKERFVVLDCEVAWFGDPAFDLAFLFNHFMLKALYHFPASAPYLALLDSAWQAYVKQLSSINIGDLELRTARLLLMLMLARIDGKSPAEYITDHSHKQAVRHFVCEELPKHGHTFASVRNRWLDHLVKSLPD
jgi:aminoglycoside phosphotransferase (APT) family kinase protein